MRIVGLSGYARSGKNAAAGGLQQFGWAQAAVADRLKLFVEATDSLVAEAVATAGGWEQAKDAYGHVRARLQVVASSARDVLGDDVWVRAVLDHDYGAVPGLVITDVRYPNEVKRIRDAGGLIVRIERPGVRPANAHHSEVALDNCDWDHVIVNDSTVEALQYRLVEYATQTRPMTPLEVRRALPA
jgi:hypothetical protein